MDYKKFKLNLAGAVTILASLFGACAYLQLYFGSELVRTIKILFWVFDGLLIVGGLWVTVFGVLWLKRFSIGCTGGEADRVFLSNASPGSNQLPPPKNYDLLTVFTQLGQGYSIIGPPQVGKTHQAQHIASYWLDRGCTPVVIGEKFNVGEWVGCTKFGGKDGIESIGRGLQWVKREGDKRHASSKDHRAHDVLPVFLDDWTSLVTLVKLAKNFIVQSSTTYASVNIILYFLLHSDTASTYGVERRGAALKDHFVKLFLLATHDDSGKPNVLKTTGVLRLPNGEEHPIKLFGKINSRGAVIKQLSETVPTDHEQDTGEAITDSEQATLNAWDGGIKAKKPLARILFNSETVGGVQTNAVTELLIKHNRTNGDNGNNG